MGWWHGWLEGIQQEQGLAMLRASEDYSRQTENVSP